MKGWSWADCQEIRKVQLDLYADKDLYAGQLLNDGSLSQFLDLEFTTSQYAPCGRLTLVTDIRILHAISS